MTIKSTTTKLIATGLFSIGMLGMAQTAAAIPTPDTVTSCPSNPNYQMHYWNMLFGSSHTQYYYVTPQTSTSAATWTSITPLAYISACPHVRPPKVFAEVYANVEYVDFYSEGVFSVGGLVRDDIARPGTVLKEPAIRADVYKERAAVPATEFKR